MVNKGNPASFMPKDEITRLAGDVKTLKAIVRKLQNARTVDYTTVTVNSPFYNSVNGRAMPAYVLQLSPTDAAHNDAEIEKAIASFNGMPGTIFAPACPPNAPPATFHDNFGTWPIARRHDFKNCDLVGTGAFGNSGATVDSSYPGTTFFCVSPNAGFTFSGIGHITGGFQINGGQLSTRLFERTVSGFDTGFDCGRLFVNIYCSDGGPSADIGLTSGWLIAKYGSSATTMTLTVTNIVGVEATSALTVATSSAADVQTALEALPNVGVGNVAVTSVNLDVTPQLGGPYHFTFTGPAAESTLTTDVSGRYSVPYVISDLSQDTSMVYIEGFLDTYINFSTGAAWEHNVYLRNIDGVSFQNMTLDNCGGHALAIYEGTNLTFTDGEWDGAGLSLVFFETDAINCSFSGQSVFYQGASAVLDLSQISNPNTISNLDYNGNDSPLFLAGSLVQLAGGIVWSGPGQKFAVFPDEFAFLDNKATIYPTVDAATDCVYRGAATAAQAAAVLQTGLAHNGFAGFFAAPPITQPTAAGVSSGYVTGAGLPVLADGTFTGGVGTTAYTLDDIVAALKNLGLIAS